MREPTERPAGITPDRAALAPRFLRAWYLATPGFAVLDFALGLNVRVTFLDSVPGRLAWYAFACACGLAVLRWPGREALVGLLESGVNMAWLIFAVMLQYLSAVDSALADDVLPSAPFTTAGIVNLIVSALVLIVSYVAAQARLGQRFARRPLR
jgi:hypothetical protein